jgi:hypothetical protein
MINAPLITQYDAIDVTQIPVYANAVAGYVGGYWPDYSALCACFPNALHKSVCVSADEDGDVLDIEHGDALPSQAPAWWERQRARGLQCPDLYADAAEMPAVIAVMVAAGIDSSQFGQWMAWLGPAELPPGVKARQYTFTALGRNLDASICDPSFWPATPAPPVRNPPHYERFYAGPFLVRSALLDERAVVRRYDFYRAQQTGIEHPYRLQLAILRYALGLLAGRVLTVARAQPRDNGRPSWGVDHRGWRYQQLIHRAHGQRFV